MQSYSNSTLQHKYTSLGVKSYLLEWHDSSSTLFSNLSLRLDRRYRCSYYPSGSLKQRDASVSAPSSRPSSTSTGWWLLQKCPILPYSVKQIIRQCGQILLSAVYDTLAFSQRSRIIWVTLMKWKHTLQRFLDDIFLASCAIRFLTWPCTAGQSITSPGGGPDSSTPTGSCRRSCPRRPKRRPWCSSGVRVSAEDFIS